MTSKTMKTDIPSLNRLRAAAVETGAPPFEVGNVVGSGYFPLNMVGVQAILGTTPGAEITGQDSTLTRKLGQQSELPSKLLRKLSVPI